MYSQQTSMAPQKPETFMLSTEAQQALPPDAQVALQQVDNLKYFLISAPVDWQPDQYIRRFLLPTGEYVSCVLWSNLFHISGTDIVRCLSFRFQAFGRPVKNSKKFEEGIFSDLRNLKSGTDASLEEPKSGFLDFLYKNNCIRTQKKQKVFYWYSVPHDRLFLDALERDLKREKMGQEATTVAVSEPALSFQYDSSQSLYEQLTKAQQANSSSFSAQQPTSFAPPQSTSPVMRDMDTMPPPHMMPQSMPPLIDGLEAMVPFQAMTMAPSVVPQHVIKREPDFSRDYGRMAAYQQSGMTAPVAQQRHVSMPAFTLECSPAPSYVSSLYDDYGNRGLSFEPITPPQQTLGMGAEPAYIANDEGGLYGTIPDHLSGGLGGLMHLQPSNLTGQHYSRGFGGNGVYNVIEGCPTYKQRRRRSSIPPPMSAMAATTVTTNTMVHRPSDLRRSVSVSANGALAEGEETDDMSPPGLSYSGSAVSSASQQVKEMLEMSRHNTPLSAIDDSANMNPLNPLNIQQSEEFSMMHDPMSEIPLLDAQRKILHGQPGAIRRARSSTMDIGPYPQKSHSCPIPTCARLFKRLEHLKRHLRTHTHEKPYICPYCNRPFSRSDNLAQHKRTHKEDGEGNFNPSGEEEEDDYSGDDPHGSADNASPTSENAYVTTSIGSVGDLGSHLGAMATGVSMPHTMGRLQNMSMPMSMSTSSTLHASTMI